MRWPCDVPVNTPLFRAALRYHDLGLSVIPLRPGDKAPPRGLKWTDFQRRRPDHAQIQAWWLREPNANVAIVCGEVSGLVVLDIDPRNGGQASLDRLTAERGPLPRTVTVQTGGGGLHLYFRCEKSRLSRLPSKIAPGIELLGKGHYVVAPPSRHPSGGTYTFAEGGSLDEVEVAPLPEWLNAELKSSAPKQPNRSKRGTMPVRKTAASPPEQASVQADINRIEAKEMLRLVPGLRETQNGWVGCCPFHDDKQPSFHVYQQPDGKPRWCCYAGCLRSSIRRGGQTFHGGDLRDLRNKMNIDPPGDHYLDYEALIAFWKLLTVLRGWPDDNARKLAWAAALHSWEYWITLSKEPVIMSRRQVAQYDSSLAELRPDGNLKDGGGKIKAAESVLKERGVEIVGVRCPGQLRPTTTYDFRKLLEQHYGNWAAYLKGFDLIDELEKDGLLDLFWQPRQEHPPS